MLERMRSPDEYTFRRLHETEAHYPEYRQLVSEYVGGGIGFSGCFIKQGKGYVGRESGNDPREGYFEFVDGQFVLATSPDASETERLLAEIHQYDIDRSAAYMQAEEDSDADFARLAELLKDNLYSWWD
ncbi:hypothetical protein AGMMS49992_33430 [Clostridia bacterium]|nr:hypothetical protein AGMMS49992_33430 [Clostridia bacterium]